MASRQIVRAMPTGSKLLALECRQSLCRVEVSHSDLASHQKFMHEAFFRAGGEWEGPTMSTLADRSGRTGVVTISFLARPGASVDPEDPAPR